MDILILADKSTSVYRKPTHTNLYVRYNSCAHSSSKDSAIRSLTRRAHILCSPQHLQKELDTVYTTSLQNGHPPDRVKRIMDSDKQKLENPNKLTLKQFNRQLKAITPSLTASFPFHPTITKKFLVMTAMPLQWTDEPTLNQNDQRTWIPLNTPLTQPRWLLP